MLSSHHRYIEAAKARMYGSSPQAAATSQAVLVYVFNTLLKLAHPFMPYITEELWQALPHPASAPALITAPWPAIGAPTCTTALAQFEVVKDVVRAVRNARAEYGVEPSRKVGAVLVVSEPGLRAAMEEEVAATCLLAKLEPEQVRLRVLRVGCRV
jgi:valyl-tRNA synthetase